MNLNYNKRELEKICSLHGIQYLGLFGSYARREASDKSDIDILVKFSKPVGLIEFIGIEKKLSEVFHRKVDLATENAITPLIKENVYLDLVQIYSQDKQKQASSASHTRSDR